jgi:Ser/Thr protein kinase RdoA (MazF antagonist)
MTATGSRLTAPPAGLLEAVEARYDGGPFAFVRTLAGGWANDIFLLEGAVGRVVARLKHPPSDERSIRWEHDLVARLSPVVPEVVAPFFAHDGATFFLYEGDAVSIVPFVEGAPADRGREEHRRAAAGLLGRLHAATFRLDVPARPGIDGLAELRKLAPSTLPSDWRGQMERLHREALELLEVVERSALIRGVLHGDYFRGNVLMRDDDVVGLLDWEEAHPSVLVYELANGVWEFTKSKETDDFDLAAAARFVDAYREAGGPVPEREDDLIVPLIRAKRVLEILRAPNDRLVDWEYQAHNLRSAENLR